MRIEPQVDDLVMLDGEVYPVERRLGRYFFVIGHKFHSSDDRTGPDSWQVDETKVTLLKT